MIDVVSVNTKDRSPGSSSASEEWPTDNGYLVARGQSGAARAGSPGHAQPPQPTTVVEQYWAARALRAEALLDARMGHQAEMSSATRAADLKREVRVALGSMVSINAILQFAQRDINHLNRMHDLRTRRLEHVVASSSS